MRLHILLAATLLLAACAQTEYENERSRLGTGESANVGQNSTLQTTGSSTVRCAASGPTGTVTSGSLVSVRVYLTNGSTPWDVVGIQTGITSSDTTISGTVTLDAGATSVQTVTRRILVSTPEGLGHCLVALTVAPAGSFLDGN